VIHWTQKYDQAVHENYERYEVDLIATPINSNKFTDFDCK